MPVLRACRRHGGVSDSSCSLNQTRHRPAAALFETGGIAKRTKTARLRRNTQPFYHPKIRITW